MLVRPLPLPDLRVMGVVFIFTEDVVVAATVKLLVLGGQPSSTNAADCVVGVATDWGPGGVLFLVMGLVLGSWCLAGI